MSTAASPPTAGAARHALVYLLAGAAMISTSAVFVKLTSVPPTTSGFYRMLFGGAILALLAWRRQAPRPRGQKAWLVLVIAGLFFALDLWFWHRSIHYVGPGLATLLANFQVFALALIGVTVLRERLRWDLLIAIPLALYGLSLIVGVEWHGPDPAYRRGVIFGLLTAASYAGYILALRYTRSGGSSGSPGADLAVVSLCTAGFLAASAGVERISLAIPDGREALLLVGYGFVAQVLGWVLIAKGLAGVPASRVGVVLLIQPLLAYLWDVLFFSGPLTGRQLAGAGMTVFAIWLASRPRHSR